MSTRVLPFTSFMNFNNRMSDLRRRIQPPPVPVTQPNQDQAPIPGQSQPVHQTRSVRRNLFGPVDHEENMKSVQAELNKIAESDARRWNFDFHSEKPLEGRFSWESVTGSKVPVAYEMPNLTARLTQLNPTPSTSTIKTVTSVPKTNTTSSASPTVLSAFTSTTTSSDDLSSALRAVTTASTTVNPSTVKTSFVPAGETIKSSEPRQNITTRDPPAPKKSVGTATPRETVVKINTKQSHITDFLKVRKRPRSPSETESKAEEVPSPLLKRARSST